ncbi:LADA_0D02608g1_1 [Lachancea dasiensis]|uniref:LADA_0D02608g1_1 n=1 Tax=Lachancea dasiensis TaxID=1072105 RepID=A0A1G4J486_9SACH|nr:LADA_0D02608g1_1 [Lachancea dasiensis]
MRNLGVVAFLLALTVGAEVRMPLFVQKPGDAVKAPLATLVYDRESNIVNVTEVNESLQEDSYCVGAQMDENYYSCFSYVKLRYPLHYDLYLDTSHNTHLLYKLSLKPNPRARGIESWIRDPELGPEAHPVKLRRVTKTYDDKKKASLKSGSASFEEDIDVDERSFLQKNWKYIVIGLVLYALSSAGQQS